MAATAHIQFSSETTALDASCCRLREISPDYPRVYAVATMAHQGKRRWCQSRPVSPAPTISRRIAWTACSRACWRICIRPMPPPFRWPLRWCTRASSDASPPGRDRGEAWDPGVDNLWVHMDSDNGIDWAAVVDNTRGCFPTTSWSQRGES